MSRRIERVNELLKREISAVLQRDFEFDGSLVTINAVEVAQDLKDARVFVGVLGGREGAVIERLNNERGHTAPQKPLTQSVITIARRTITTSAQSSRANSTQSHRPLHTR